MEQVLFVMILGVGLFVVLSHNLKRVIVAMSVLSLLATCAYLFYHAPDVAIAEGIIGCALTTILFIIAFKKHRTFYLYVTSSSKAQINKLRRSRQTQEIVGQISRYCAAHELHMQCFYSYMTPLDISKEHVCDIILVHDEEGFSMYGYETETHVNEIIDILGKSGGEKIKHFMSLTRGDDDET